MTPAIETTPLISIYLRRYTKLKWALTACIALAIFSIVTSAVLATVYFADKRHTYKELQATLSQIESASTADNTILAQQARTLLASHDRTNRELIAIGALTLVFGVFLPVALISLISRLMTTLLTELQNSAIRIAREWSQTRMGMGDEPFKNFDFWLKTVLILNGELSRYSRHPIVQLSGELSILIKREMDRQNESPKVA